MKPIYIGRSIMMNPDWDCVIVEFSHDWYSDKDYLSDSLKPFINETNLYRGRYLGSVRSKA